MRIVITTLIITATAINSFGQKLFNDSLLKLEHTIYLTKSDTDIALLRLKKVDLYIENKDYSSDALQEILRVDYEKIKDSTVELKFLWNSAMIAQLNNSRREASHYLRQYEKISGDTSIQVYLFEVLINNGYDSAEVTKAVSRLSAYDKSFDALSCMNKPYSYEIKHKVWYAVASAIVPGSGSMINGNVGKGTASLFMNAASATAIYFLIQNNLYLNAALWGTGLGIKFYTGNIKLTTSLVEQKEQRKKNTLAKYSKGVLDNLLIKYPLNFR